MDSKQAPLDAQQSVIDTARATVEVDQANAGFAEQDDKRYATLADDRLWQPCRTRSRRRRRIAAARAAIARDTAALATALKQVDLLKAELAQAQATLRMTKRCSGRPS